MKKKKSKKKRKSRNDPIQSKQPTMIPIRTLSCPPLEKRVDYRAPRP